MLWFMPWREKYFNDQMQHTVMDISLLSDACSVSSAQISVPLNASTSASANTSTSDNTNTNTSDSVRDSLMSSFHVS